MSLSTPQLIVIAGPTASGKSELAQQIALERRGEILNFDSQQFYRGLEIGTGKVPKNQQRVPHWFLEVVEPGERISAMDFVRMAEPVLAELHRKNKLPILVGGTGLYLRALVEGLDLLPGRDPEIRQKLETELRQKGVFALYQRLQEIDPLRAQQIQAQDSARIIRALEIFQSTGQLPSQLLTRGRPEFLKYPTQTYWLSPPREELWKRIEVRVGEMFAQGWIQEVEDLLNTGHDPRVWPHRPLGYADIAEALEQGREKEPALQEKIVVKTRQYAKRQGTFFRGLFANPAYQKQGSSLILRKNFGDEAIVNA